MTDDRRRAPNVTQLRDKIDRGRAGDKVPVLDPATAPLGTDAEAGGSRPEPSIDVADVERRVERGSHLESNRPPIAADSGELKDRTGRKTPMAVVVGLLGLACAAALALAIVALG